MRTGKLKPLWRKSRPPKPYLNHHMKELSASRDRNTKAGVRRSMSKTRSTMRDFTPLYQYLLSAVGEDFDMIKSHVYKRLEAQDRDVIWNMVATNDLQLNPDGIVRLTDNAYYSQLYVDNDNILKVYKPEVTINHLFPHCSCCTHTFNGTKFINPYDCNNLNTVHIGK